MKSFFSSRVSRFSILIVICSLSISALGLSPTASSEESPKVNSNAECRDPSNTGIDFDEEGNTILLDDGKGDPHYKLTLVPQGSTSQTRVRRDEKGWPLFPGGPYLRENGTSLWIGPNNNSALDGPTGKYIYETTFKVGDVTKARIEGRWSSDNDGVEILLNGKKVSGATGFEQFRSFVPFRITAGFQKGTNTLAFVVNNGWASPTALRVEFNQQRRWSRKDDRVEISATLEKDIDKISKTYYEATCKELIVTDGQRSAASQAQAIFNKLRVDGENAVRQLYKNKILINEVITAWRNAANENRLEEMTRTIQSQIDRGDYISLHLTSKAFDVRSRTMSEKEKRAFKEAVYKRKGKVVDETSSGEPHYHVQIPQE